MNIKPEQVLLNSFINKCILQYTDFMGIAEMPSFDVVPINLSVDGVNKKGYGAFATHYYDINTGTH